MNKKTENEIVQGMGNDSGTDAKDKTPIEKALTPEPDSEAKPAVEH
jgi:hypothetical protein